MSTSCEPDLVSFICFLALSVENDGRLVKHFWSKHLKGKASRGTVYYYIGSMCMQFVDFGLMQTW